MECYKCRLNDMCSLNTVKFLFKLVHMWLLQSNPKVSTPIKILMLPVIFERASIQFGLELYKMVQNDYFLPINNGSNLSK